MARICTTANPSDWTEEVLIRSRERTAHTPEATEAEASDVPFYTLHVAFTPYGPEPLWIWISDIRRGDWQ